MTDSSKSNSGSRREPDLIDVWLQVRRHRVAFLAGFLSCVLAGLAVSILIPPRYGHKMVVEVGGVWAGGSSIEGASAHNFRFVETPETVKAKIEQSYYPRAATASSSLPEEADVVVAEDSGLVQVELSVPTTSSGAALDALTRISDQIVDGHNHLIQERLEVLRTIAESRLAELNSQLASLASSRELVAAKGDSADKGLTLLLIDAEIQELRRERQDAENRLKVDLALNIKKTAVIAGPTRSVDAVGPGFALITAVSIFLGLLFGFAIVSLRVINELVRRRLNDK